VYVASISTPPRIGYTPCGVTVTRPGRRTLLIGAAVTVLYVVTAAFGFRYALVAEQVTTVWAPTGLAQAVLLLWGRRLWPAVWLGAFAVNASTAAPLWTAFPIATGNTLEALAAAWLLARLAGFDPALRRTRDTLAFIVIAAGLGPVISATCGVLALCAAGVQAWSSFWPLWSSWYLGDATGALVVGPAILTVARGVADRTVRSWFETILIVGATLAVTLAVFGQWIGPASGHHPLEYVIFPFLVIAAVRQGQPATALVVCVSAGIAIANTAAGSGPFADGAPLESLVLLQVFMTIVAGTGLLLAAAITERQTSEHRRAAAHEVSAALATAVSLEDAARTMLPGVCRSLGWDYGAVWIVEPGAPAMTCVAAWPPDSRFARGAARHTFTPGVGLPGRVWASRQPAWIENVQVEPNFPRVSLAREAGLHGAFAFPITVGTEVLGVIEFFNRSILRPDADLLATLATVGSQLGQFVVRTRVEAAVLDGQRERDELLQRELAARREAEAANRAKDEFLATLSHELRTPLNAIVGWTRMLLDGSVDEGNRRRALEVIERNAHLQAQLVADILDVSGIITGGLKLTPAPVDLVTVIGAALDALRPAADAKGLLLTADLSPDPILVKGDAQRLQQVVWNLVANAIKFTPPGGRVDVVLREADGAVTLFVHDTGDGIEPDFLPYVFDRFRQGDGSVSRLHGGLGLGLAIVRHLVELHGGSVRAESAGPGQGATFIVSLPRMMAAPADAAYPVQA
jgi:signal transduction histidine kinase/integral membrane sensor domain MASE1